VAVTPLGTGGVNSVTWAATTTATRAGVDPAEGGVLVWIGYNATDGGTGSGGSVSNSGWTGTAPTWSTPITIHSGSSVSIAMAYSTNAYTGSGSVVATFTSSGDTYTGCAVVELTGGTFTFADDATAGAASTITLSPAGNVGVAAFHVAAATTDHVWSGFAEVFDSTENAAGGVGRASFAADESSPTGSPSATPNTGTRCMAGLSFTTDTGTATPAAISTPFLLPQATPTGDLLPYVVASGGASLSTDDPSVTFSGYTPRENDVVALFVSSTTVLGAVVDGSLPSGWVNPLGSGAEINSDAHGMAAFYHLVTAAEESGVTTTYTATNALDAAETGYVQGVVVRRVNPSAPIDGFNTAQDSGNTVTPHVLAGITGSGVLLDGSLVVSSVAKDATGAYSSVPGGWTQLRADNTNNGRWLGVRDTYTTVNTNVNATNITPSAGDEYCSITLAFAKVPAGNATATPAATSVAVALPAVTPQAGTVTSPAATSVAVALGQVTAGESTTAQPAATSVAVALPAATPLAGSTVTPAATSVAVTIPAATASGTAGVVSDDFNRANSDTVGDPWVERQGDWDISSNGVIQTDATSQPGFLLYNVALGADHWIEATLAVSNGSGNIGLMIRFDDTEADCLSWEVADGAYKLIHADDGEAAGTIFTGSSHDHTTGERYRATVEGNTTKFFLNDVEVASTTTSTYAGATRVGLHLHENSSGAVRWDNFRAGVMPYVPNDTAFPSSISVPVTIPQATGQASQTATPAATTITVTVPAVTTSGGATPAPDAISVPVTIPQATPLASSTVTPAATPITVTIPQAAATGSTAGTASPAAITTAAVIPQVTPQAGSTVAPAVIPVSVTIPQATGSGATAGTATPSVISATVTIPAVITQAGSTAAPAAISTPFVPQQATGQASHTATPAVIPVTVTIPAATTAGGASAAPTAIPVGVTLPALTLNYGSTVTPAVLAIAIALGAVTATGIIPDAHPITLTVAERNYTITVLTPPTTSTVRERGQTTTAREQR
jgi:hypothetical protein